MKKLFAFLSVVIIISISLSACSDTQQSSSEPDTAPSVEINTFATEANEGQYTTVNPLAGEITGTESESFVLPDDNLHLDIQADDLSNDDVKFVYDAMNRISSYTYYVKGYENFISYTYLDGNKVEIMSFVNGVLAADVTITYSAYDTTVGFTVNHGYYFKSIVF